MKAAVIGSGNIGTDLLIKILRGRGVVTAAAMVGIDPDSEGLARARRLKVPTSSDGVAGLIALDGFDGIDVVFDATSAAAHHRNAAALAPYGKTLIDLTPAAVGPYVVPSVNLDEHLAAPNLNMVTCGGQATVPVVAAVSAVTPVHYAEIVASIASRSAGPGTRANIDEFTETTSRALERVGGAARGKAIIVLNPAEPALLMRDTVHCLVDDADTGRIADSVRAKAAEVAAYVPGYRLKQEPQFRTLAADDPLVRLGGGARLLVSVYLEVEGAAHHLPAYAGNLDIMTAAALRTAERLAERSGNR
ncbi:acetaldehyde dehydrogenase (acetylating) [Streptomyces termitum]|uniref:Acetaldehyde dehydrogenase n=1 Tax=Streptomyces termitum TaxID=67368 RepID=A0A918W7N3_9ACTN|nr:acetaldehyde dehydrogenase (acetylating) [Streptomyces termitum]GHA78073.1 acetaldehyde dehydrogenase 2 [Streptomyces termitum]